MTFLKAASTVFCTALMGGMFSPSAKADEHDKKTTITFSGPVEIPPVYITGMRILPAGTYVFKLVESSSNRHIVQIFNKDQISALEAEDIEALDSTQLGAISTTAIAGLKPEAVRAHG